MKSPRVSVIIPSFNGERLVGDAVESVLAQTQAAHEIIVINDGSTDRTAAVGRSFGARIRYVEQPNSGVSVARNHGVKLATGDFFAFLDHDDLWTPHKLALQLEAFNTDPDLQVAYGHMIEFDERNLVDGLPKTSKPEPSRMAGTILIRRDAFQRVGLFKPGLKIAEWLEWCLRAQEAKLHERMLPDVLMRRRIHAHNTGFLQISERGNLVRSIKEALDRRRAAARPDTA